MEKKEDFTDYYVISDIETTKWNNSMISGDNLEVRLICAIFYDSSNELKRFQSEKIEDFFIWLDAIKKEYNITKCLRIYYHNARFDVKFLMEELEKLEYTLSPIFSASRLLSLKIKIAKRTIYEVVDSLSILLASIERLGEMNQLSKLDMAKDKLIDYCFRDCEVCQKSLVRFTEFIKRYDSSKKISRLNKTIASNAFSLLFKMNEKYDYYDDDKKKRNKIVCYDRYINELHREYYFGGRTEVFNFNIAKKLKGYDKNSEYTKIMVENKFPIPPYFKYHNGVGMSAIEVLKNDKMYSCFCEVDERGRIEPAFPEHIKIGNNVKCIFRAHTKSLILFRKEIEYCISHNIPIKIIDILECDEWGDIFAYMKPLVEERFAIQKVMEETNTKDFFEYLIKIFLHSTYGKFAEKEMKELMVIINNNTDTCVEEIDRLEESGFKCSCRVGNLEVYRKQCKVKYDIKSNVAIASMITAYARLDLLISMETIHYELLFYCDTDSLFTEDTMPTSKLLGEMKLEYSCNFFMAINVKCYRFFNTLKNKDTIKCKGIHEATNLSDLYDNKVNNTYVRPTSIKEAFSSHKKPGEGKKSKRKPIGFNSVTVVNKHNESIYDKRRINNDLTTSPWSDENPYDYAEINKANYIKVLEQLGKYEKHDYLERTIC